MNGKNKSPCDNNEALKAQSEKQFIYFVWLGN